MPTDIDVFPFGFGRGSHRLHPHVFWFQSFAEDHFGESHANFSTTICCGIHYSEKKSLGWRSHQSNPGVMEWTDSWRFPIESIEKSFNSHGNTPCSYHGKCPFFGMFHEFWPLVMENSMKIPIFHWDFPWFLTIPIPGHRDARRRLRQLDSVKALLDLGADVNRPSKTGRSNLRVSGSWELMMGLAQKKKITTVLLCCCCCWFFLDVNLTGSKNQIWSNRFFHDVNSTGSNIRYSSAPCLAPYVLLILNWISYQVWHSTAHVPWRPMSFCSGTPLMSAAGNGLEEPIATSGFQLDMLCHQSNVQSWKDNM